MYYIVTFMFYADLFPFEQFHLCVCLSFICLSPCCFFAILVVIWATILDEHLLLLVACHCAFYHFLFHLDVFCAQMVK